MYSQLCSAVRGGVLSAAVAAVSAFTAIPAQASVLLPDNYYGGLDTWNYPSDVIGDPSVFGISSALIQRTNGGNTLEVTINTAYAGRPGTPAADGTGYGVLFITPGPNAWTPHGTGPRYTTDQYQTGDWMYAATIPMNPGAATTGSGGLYLTTDGTIIMSNVYGNTTTAPYPGNPGYYFRANQAVQFDARGANPLTNTSEQWTVSPGAITFDITDNGLLGDQFALSWAMTCANDVIQGQVDVPEPPTWPLLLAGLFILGGFAWRGRASPVSPRPEVCCAAPAAHSGGVADTEKDLWCPPGEPLCSLRRFFKICQDSDSRRTPRITLTAASRRTRRKHPCRVSIIFCQS